jgi:BlaI family transcriptional regulator, penicillinase repressor
MEVVWDRGPASIRQIQEALAGHSAYTTIQTTVYRLEAKHALNRVDKIGNAHIFAAAVARHAAHRRLMDEWLSFFGGRTQPVMAHWIESGQLTLDDLQQAEAELRARSSQKEAQSQAATESSVGGDRDGGSRNSEGRPAAVKQIPPDLRSAVAEDGGSDAASRSRGGLERREASLKEKEPV